MRFLKYLTEEYVALATYRNFSTEIFVNPSRKDFLNMAKPDPLGYDSFIKYIISSKNPKSFVIYCWSGPSAIHHATVIDVLRKNGLWKNFVIMGRGKYDPVKGKILNITTSYTEFSTNYKDIDMLEFKKWLKTHFIMDGLPSSLMEDN
jgi:hypothetical protein